MTQPKLFPHERILTDSFKELPRGFYQTVVADPPWMFENKKTGGSHKSGACQQYDVMTLQEIIDLPVRKIAADTSILYLWISTALKADILNSALLRSWGFTYKTSLYWHKVGGRLGLGHYYRGDVEECLICIRGEQEAFHQQIPNIFDAPRGSHSEKPQKFWDDYVFPVVKKFDYDRNIELFCRSPQPDWDAFGNQISTESDDDQKA